MTRCFGCGLLVFWRRFCSNSPHPQNRVWGLGCLDPLKHLRTPSVPPGSWWPVLRQRILTLFAATFLAPLALLVWQQRKMLYRRERREQRVGRGCVGACPCWGWSRGKPARSHPFFLGYYVYSKVVASMRCDLDLAQGLQAVPWHFDHVNPVVGEAHQKGSPFSWLVGWFVDG